MHSDFSMPTVRSGSAILLVAVMSCYIARESAAQPVLDTTRSTLSGVYTEAQAVRGNTVFLGYCRSCHAPIEHTGLTFKRQWVGRTVMDMFEYVSQTMPTNDPGSLSAQDNADVVAYLLRLNLMPAGITELPTDGAVLKMIRIVAPVEKPAGKTSLPQTPRTAPLPVHSP